MFNVYNLFHIKVYIISILIITKLQTTTKLPTPNYINKQTLAKYQINVSFEQIFWNHVVTAKFKKFTLTSATIKSLKTSQDQEAKELHKNCPLHLGLPFHILAKVSRPNHCDKSEVFNYVRVSLHNTDLYALIQSQHSPTQAVDVTKGRFT